MTFVRLSDVICHSHENPISAKMLCGHPKVNLQI